MFSVKKRNQTILDIKISSFFVIIIKRWNMKLIFVRHGQTDANLNNLINGLNDGVLNETGIEQAKEAANKIDTYDYGFIISSPLTRAKQTAEIINTKNKKIIYDDRIVERDFGDYTLKQVPENESDWWNAKQVKNYENGESVIELIERVYNFIDEIKDAYPLETIIVVSHGGVYKCIMAYVNGIPEDGNINIFDIDNCGIIEFDL